MRKHKHVFVDWHYSSQKTLECLSHDDVIKWKHFPRYWPFVRGIHRSPVNSPHKDQWRGALMFTLICARINSWVNNREAGDQRRYRAHYDVRVMLHVYPIASTATRAPTAMILAHFASINPGPAPEWLITLLVHGSQICFQVIITHHIRGVHTLFTSCALERISNGSEMVHERVHTGGHQKIFMKFLVAEACISSLLQVYITGHAVWM